MGRKNIPPSAGPIGKLKIQLDEKKKGRGSSTAKGDRTCSAGGDRDDCGSETETGELKRGDSIVEGKSRPNCIKRRRQDWQS